MTSQQREPIVDLGDGGPGRRLVAVEYLVASLITASVALLPGWTGVHDGAILTIAVSGLLSGAGLLLVPAWPLLSHRAALVGAAVTTSVCVYAADGSPAVGVFVALYCATAAHIPFLRSVRGMLAATALPFLLLPTALLASGHPGQVAGWLAVLPATTVLPVLGVRSLLSLAARRARRDGGSELLNRRGLFESCAEQLQASEGLAGQATVSVAHFDDLRDLRLALGPAAAEEVIAECARRAADLPGAVVARIDQDSLAVVRPAELDGSGEATSTCRAEGRVLLDVLREHVVLSGDGPGQGLTVRPDVSIGVACAPQHGREVEELLALADVAAVRAAGDQEHVAVAEGEAAFDADALRLHAELPAAVEAGQLRVHYQRLVAAGTGRTVGVEALVRWQHPERGLLGPGAFIPLAERSQAIVGLTYWVLRTAAAQCAAWRAEGHDVGVSVNVSPVVLADPALLNAVRRAVAENHLGDGVLTLEVTESALLGDPEGAGAVLADLRAAGARISLDDFGTGYTSLTMLRQLEVDELKIDRCFVAAAAQVPADTAIVRALVDLAHRLSMEVVAEGVEDASTADLIHALGADVLQGFHFARPVPAADVFPSAPVGSGAPSAAEPAPAPRGADEEERVQLAHTVLRSARSSADVLSSITALAAAVSGTQFASFNAVTEEHVHLLAPHGHETALAPRDGTPCAWTVQQHDVLHLDPSTDGRGAGGSASQAGIQHYVGAPVIDAAGRVLGVLCAYDRGLLPSSDLQRSQLQLLADVVADHLAGIDVADRLDGARNMLRAVAELDDGHHRVPGPDRVVATFATAVHELLRPDHSLVVHPAPSGAGPWQLLEHRGDVDPHLLTRVGFDLTGRSAVARSIATGRPVWVPDAATSSLEESDLTRHLGAAAILTVPVTTGHGGVSHVLVAVWRDPQHELDPVLRTTAVAIAGRAARELAAPVADCATPVHAAG
ncbi:EAL domain-containing protein [Kineococcus sp. NBC_00420]|uniref:EAL domain-containing protein n=1 Tax=Kineococcus sp. NBC_00420 TaxID=2903564 RepID=UPI002E1EEEC1